MTSPTASTLAIISARVSAERKHLLLPGVRLDALGLTSVDHWGIAVDLETDHCTELDWPAVEAWQTVNDVQGSVDRAGGENNA